MGLLPASTMTFDEVRRATQRDEICREPRRLLQEHAILLSGGHFDLDGHCSTDYMNFHAILDTPFLITQLAGCLIDLSVAANDADVIAGPLTGGAVLAFTIAGILSGRSKRGTSYKRFVPLHPDGNEYFIKPHYAALLPGKRVWLVDDVLRTGNTLAWCAAKIDEAGGSLIATSVILQNVRGVVIRDRALNGVSHDHIDKFSATSVPRNQCPQCAAGVDFTKF